MRTHKFTLAVIVLLLMTVALPAMGQESHFASVVIGDMRFGFTEGLGAFAKSTTEFVEFADERHTYGFARRDFKTVRTSYGRVAIWSGDVTDESLRLIGKGVFYTPLGRKHKITLGYASIPGGLLSFHPSGVVAAVTAQEFAAMHNDWAPRATGPQHAAAASGDMRLMVAQSPLAADVAIPYTDDAVNHWATGSREAVRAIQAAAEAFINGAFMKARIIGGRVRVVGIELKTAWNSNDPRLKKANCLSGPCGQVAREAGKPVRDATGADLVITLVGETGVPGATGFADAYTGNSEQAYGVASVTTGLSTLLHELDHLFDPNKNHEKAHIQCGTDPNNAVTQFASVTVATETWASFGSLPTWCQPSVIPDLLSNPNVTRNGLPTGDVQHNNAAGIRAHLVAVSNFRTPQQ